MPQLSDTMKIGVLQKWRKNEGDKVSPGEVIAEVETDKAVMDFEAFDEGVLLKRLIADGASVPVGTPIAIIGKAGEDVAKLIEEAKARAGAGAAKPAAAPPARCARRAPARRRPPPTAGCRPPRNPPLPRPAGARAGPPPAGSGQPRPQQVVVQGAGVAAAAPAGDRSRHRPPQLRGHRPRRPHRRARRRPPRRAARMAPPGRGRRQKRPPGPPRRVSAALLPAQIVPDRRSEARPAHASRDDCQALSMMRRTIATRLSKQVDVRTLSDRRRRHGRRDGLPRAVRRSTAPLPVNDLVLKARPGAAQCQATRRSPRSDILTPASTSVWRWRSKTA
jgi:pyruvate dehydrogenase E2 component (dihydrolipoamide acetyltransferase)